MSAVTLEDRVDVVFANDAAAVNKAMKLYMKISSNILQNQSESKYRRLNKEKVYTHVHTCI